MLIHDVKTFEYYGELNGYLRVAAEFYKGQISLEDQIRVTITKKDDYERDDEKLRRIFRTPVEFFIWLESLDDHKVVEKERQVHIPNGYRWFYDSIARDLMDAGVSKVNALALVADAYNHFLFAHHKTMAEVQSWIIWNAAGSDWEAEEDGYRRIPRYGRPAADVKKFCEFMNGMGRQLRNYNSEQYSYITRWAKDWKPIKFGETGTVTIERSVE